jgi:hypothetical protein
MKPTSDWRSQIKVHPAAELFPLMSPDELRVLGEDIKANGVKTQITTWVDAAGTEWLIDGRNRLDAMQVAGYTFAKVKVDHGTSCAPTIDFRIYKPGSRVKEWSHQYAECIQGRRFHNDDIHPDPYTLAVSYNINRRHLTGAQKSDLIEKLLKADPTKSDRAVAEVVKVDHKTVGAKRAALSATGEIPQSGTPRTGADGKTRKLPKASSVVAEPSVEDIGVPSEADFVAAGPAGAKRKATRYIDPSETALLQSIATGLAKLVGKDPKRERAIGMLRRAQAAIEDAFGKDVS